MRLNKDDIYSLIGTVAFHGVILLILWFTVLKTEVPDEDGGVLVNFGNVNAAAGMFEPKYTGQEPPQETTTPPPPVPEPQVETPKQELITQDIEESVALEDAKRRKRKRNARNKRLRRNGKKRRRKNVSAGKKPRRSVWPRNAARRNRPLATRWPELLVWETPRVTAKATLKAEPVTKEVRSVTLITGLMKA